MSLFDSLRYAQDHVPDVESQQDVQLYSDPSAFANEFNSYKSEPTLYANATQYISPYAYDNWGGVTGIIASFDESSRSPATIIENRVDPNKIYTAELAALRSNAADQIRITKLFEKKLMEGLKDKDKFGLNENDIMAMQSLTAARSAVTAINKEMIAIKKNISELRLKQEQNKQMRGAQPVVEGGTPLPTAPSDIGHSVLDDIFDKLPRGTSIDYDAAPYDDTRLVQDIDRASSLIDDVVSDGSVNKYTQYERLNPTTYLMVGQSDDDVEFATFSSDGELLEDYPNPVSNIEKIDRDLGVAIDDLKREYPIRKKE